LEEHTTSIFSFKELAKQEISMKQEEASSKQSKCVEK
jgi:hypothetical protein